MIKRCPRCARTFDDRNRGDDCPHPLKPLDDELRMRLGKAIHKAKKRRHVVVGDHPPELRRS